MAKWGYGASNGPATWSKNWPKADGDKQSPVDIQTGSAVKEAMSPLSFNYAAENSIDICNVGWNAVAKVSQNSVLTGGPLAGSQKLDSFHLHWGDSDAAGSEHTVDGKQFAAELHICHYNSDKYGSFAEASDKADGLCLVAVLLNVGGENAAIKAMTDNVGKVTANGSKATVSAAVDPKALLPGNTGDFWCYSGALTTPPCHESAEWIIFKDAITVSAGQLASLRTIQDADGNAITKNCRPCCPLKGRTIKSS